MTAIEYPTVNDGLLPIGSFVVVELDPIASVDAFADEGAVEAASRIETRKRLALLHSPGGFPGRDPLQSYAFELVGRGRPEPPWAAAPIHPAKSESDPARSSVVPTLPLPFNDTFISTEHRIEGTLSTLYFHNNLPITMLPESQLREFYGYQIKDARRLGQLRWDEEGQVRSDDGDDAWSDISSTPTAPILCMHREPYFRVWLDLSVATDPVDPESLQKELSELRRIQRGWYYREKRDFATKGVTRVQEWLRGLESYDQSKTILCTPFERALEYSQLLLSESEEDSEWPTTSPFGDDEVDWTDVCGKTLGYA